MFLYWNTVECEFTIYNAKYTHIFTLSYAHPLTALPESVTSQLAEARDLLAKAQSVRGSDDVVGLMLLAQYKSECIQPCSLCLISTGIYTKH